MARVTATKKMPSTIPRNVVLLGLKSKGGNMAISLLPLRFNIKKKPALPKDYL